MELDNFLKNFITEDDHLCVVILNKRLFRIGQGDPSSSIDKRAYYCLIGHAYQNHLIEKITTTSHPSGFVYTFMKQGHPKTLPQSEDLKEQYGYCLNYIEPGSLSVIPINSEILPYN